MGFFSRNDGYKFCARKHNKKELLFQLVIKLTLVRPVPETGQARVDPGS
jgi:hypothetical protein